MALYKDIDFRQGGALDVLGAVPTIVGTNFKTTELGLAFEGGASKYITYDRQLLPNNAFSVVVWGRVRYSHTIGTHRASVIAYSPSEYGISLSYSDGTIGKPILYMKASNCYKYFNYTVDKKWHCWIFTVAGSAKADVGTSKCYVDTLEKAASVTDVSGDPTVRTSFIYAGSGNYTSGGAMIARIKVYDTVIDAAQILREQEEFEQARALTRMSRCSIPQANGSSITLLENWKYHGVGNSPVKRGEWIKGSGAYSVRQLTADNGFKKKGQFYLRCDTAGVIGILSSAASGKWSVEFLKNSADNVIYLSFINNQLNTGNVGSVEIRILANGGIDIAKSGVAYLMRNGTAGYLSNNTMYKFRIYRLGAVAGTFPKNLIPAATIYPAWTYLFTIEGGTFIAETIITATTNTNPYTDTTYQTSKYFCIGTGLPNDFIGDIKHETSW